MTADALATPYLAVDLDVLARNLTGAAQRAAAAGLRLRPHAKTHKSPEIARRQLELGASGLTVATVGEAEVFADAGATDLFVAYPIWAAGSRGRRLRAVGERGGPRGGGRRRAVAEGVALRVGVDSAEAAELLGAALAGTGAQVLVEIDCGMHR